MSFGACDVACLSSQLYRLRQVATGQQVFGSCKTMTSSNTTSCDSSDEHYLEAITPMPQSWADGDRLDFFVIQPSPQPSSVSVRHKSAHEIRMEWTRQHRYGLPDSSQSIDTTAVDTCHRVAHEQNAQRYVPLLHSQANEVPIPVYLYPRSWAPTLHFAMMVTALWHDIVWLWDEDCVVAHRGVAQLVQRYEIGDPPYMEPNWNSRIHISRISTDISGMPELHLTPTKSPDWFSGCCVWVVRWLDGY